MINTDAIQLSVITAALKTTTTLISHYYGQL